MRWLAPGRKALGVAAASLLTIALGVTAGVFVAGPAAAPPATTTSTTTSTTLTAGADPNAPAAHYFVINGTANAASDHERLGSSAFPNYATGAVDNYYSMARSHVDNAPFAQGTATPADTGPIGQTAAAGNFQQPQYADARWPGGGSGKATYGTQGQPYAAAEASEYKATAESSAASSGLNGTGGSSKMATPKGFNGRLRQALATWKAKWQGRLHPKTPTGAIKTPTVKTPTPTATVTTPVATVTTPTVTVGGLPATPPVSVPAPAVPSAAPPQTATPSRSTSSASTASGDGASLLESSTLATVDPKTDALVTSGESRLGRVSLGDGQIVIQGIHVSATITNDGTPTEKIAVSVGAASIGGVPVTIDQDGVHVSGQGSNLPYQQASDALNSALKQAGIQLFIVTPEIKKGCDLTAPATGTTTTTTTNSTTTNSSGPTDTNSTTSSCGPTDTNSTTSSCGPTDTNSTTNSTTTTTTTSSVLPGTTTGTTTTNSSGQTGTTTTTTTTTSSCGQTDTTTTTSACGQTDTTTTTTNPSGGTAGTTTTAATTTNSGVVPGTTTNTTTTNPSDGTGTTTETAPGQETVTATGLHLVFTQPVEQSGVPAQYAEHILGGVSLDSLAVPAGPIPTLDLSLSSSSSSSCPNGQHSGTKKKTAGGASAGGGASSAGGSSSSSSPSSSGSSQPTSGFAANGSQPTASSTGTAPQSFPARLASALTKPMWLLLSYLLWQALVIATGASLLAWRRGEAS
jgi:hypothetical protein